MSTNVTGYTGLDIDGKASLRTGQSGGFILSGGDFPMTRAQAANGIVNVAIGHATNAVVLPTAIATEFAEGGAANKIYVLVNGDAALAATIKVTGGTGVTVAATKRAIVMLNAAGTDFVRLTADA